ncbi:984_t:CDS:2, partial [Dentiscutata erythropus]
KQVQEWRKQKENLKPVKNKEQYPVLKNKLLDYIKQRSKKKQAITIFIIRNKAKELGQTLGLEDAKHIYKDVIKALNLEGLDVLEIPGETTSILQLPDISANKPFKSDIVRTRVLA